MRKLVSIFICVIGFSLIDPCHVFSQSIDSAEYFVDIDPGVRNGKAVVFIKGDSIIDTATVSTVGLSSGFHNLFVRVRDTNGVWSLYDYAKFYLADTIPQTTPPSYPIIEAESFFDTDPGIGSGTTIPIASSDSILDSLTISTTGLSSGFHSVFYRLKDSHNVWSLYEGARFYLTDTLPQTTPPSYPISAAEYFYDTDPGIGNGFPVTNFSAADSISLNLTLPTSPLTAGAHTVFVRVQDTLHQWSLYEGRSFTICNFIPAANFTADTACLHSPTVFTDLSTNLDTSAHYTYAWDFNNDGITDDTTRGNTTHIFTTAGTHTVSLFVNNTSGCADTVIKTIYVNSLPVVTFTLPKDTMCKNDTITLSGGAPAGGIYSGIGVDGGIFYGDSVSAGHHSIAYTYYNIDSCSATKYADIYVSYCTGINEYAGQNSLVNVSPNPFSETTSLQIRSPKPNVNYELMVYNLVGEKISIESVRVAEGFIIHRGDLMQGIYFYKVLSENKTVGSGKLVIID